MKYLNIFALILILQFVDWSCKTKEQILIKQSKTDLINKFNDQFTNYKVFIAVLVVNELYGLESSSVHKDNQIFIDLAGKIQSANVHNADIDSLVENIVNANPQIDFFSSSTFNALNSFIKSYDLSVYIFSQVSSDDQLSQMKEFEAKILNIEGLSKIYLQYMSGRNDMSSLSSGEGVALNLQVAYFLNTLPEVEKRRIVKSLL